MILYLKTNDNNCEVWLDDKQFITDLGRKMSRDILSFIEQCLNEDNSKYHDLTGIVVFEGPGSFTGLRIGITVANTLADGVNIPIVSARDDDWREKGQGSLFRGNNQYLVTPFYGAEANITKPRK